jgi:hypothetical protein
MQRPCKKNQQTEQVTIILIRLYLEYINEYYIQTIKWRKKNTTPLEQFQNPIEKS